jgi:hypothetical protein
VEYLKALRLAAAAQERAAARQVDKVREYLCRLARLVTRPTKFGFQCLRRERARGDIEYQIFADTEPNGTQIAWVQSTRHDAEFISAVLAQAPLFDQLLAQASEVEALRAALEWQPIETAPKDGTEILLTDGYYKRTGYWAKRIAAWSIDAVPPLNMPTHWLPLPAAALARTEGPSPTQNAATAAIAFLDSVDWPTEDVKAKAWLVRRQLEELR